MNEMPKRIWAWMGHGDNGSWDKAPCPCTSHESVEYVRSDIVPDWKPVDTIPQVKDMADPSQEFLVKTEDGNVHVAGWDWCPHTAKYYISNSGAMELKPIGWHEIPGDPIKS